MIHKSVRAAGTVLYVKNDEEGRLFLKQLRRSLNKACYKIRLRGRNPNRKQFRGLQPSVRESLRNENSSYFAVYFFTKMPDPRDARLRRAYADQIATLNQLNEARKQLKAMGIDNQILDEVIQVAESRKRQRAIRIYEEKEKCA